MATDIPAIGSAWQHRRVGVSDSARDQVHHVCAVKGERGTCGWPKCFIDDHCDIAMQIAEQERPDLADEIQRRTSGGCI